MKKLPAHQPARLVRTTVRLPKPTYQRLRTLSIEEEEPIQTILDRAIRQYARRQTERHVKDLFKYTVRAKKGVTFPFSRAELYEDVLKHRVRTDR